MTLQASDLQSNSLTGTVAVANGFITIPIATNSITFTGDKTFTITLRRTNEFGERLAVTETLTLQDKSEVLQVYANTASIAEGANVRFEIETANVADGYVLYYTFLGSNANVTSGDITPYEGSTTIYNNTGNVIIQAVEDLSNFFEEDDFFGIQLRTGSVSGTIVATSNNVAIVDTSNTAFITGTSVSRFTDLGTPYVHEGERVQIVVDAFNGIGNNAATYYYTLTGNASVYGSNSGTVIINDNTGNVVVDTEIDVVEGEEKEFAVQIRSGSTSGTVVATSDTVLVNAYSTGTYYPVVPSIVSMSPNVAQFWKETAVSFNITTTLAPDGETFYYNVTGNVAPSEVTSTSGSFSVTANVGTVTVVGSGTSSVDRTVGLEIRRSSNTGPKIAEVDAGNLATMISVTGPIEATGGNFIEDSGGFRKHIFLSSNSFTITSGTFSPSLGEISYAIVGGGGGGHKNPTSGGGGGGGGYLTGTVNLTGQTGEFVVNVGGGGAQFVSGANSTVFGISAGGGGAGGRPGVPGASGGGASCNGPALGGTGIPGQGNPGGGSNGSGIGSASSGGGGGYSEAGITPAAPTSGGGRGGDGVAVPLAPANIGATSTRQSYPSPGPASTPGGTRYFCGGGGSGCEQLNAASPGGAGGGGAGNPSQPGAPLGALAGQPAVVNSGGGGGGGGHAGGTGGTGAAGVIIIRYPIS